ncbi:FAD/NAD(P)-binding protein [Micromonospora sp. NPDC048898]|uniref:FAD/NAD(P)-binding protein n=1 Tax=Micromonospora sp. NPDC048898 TaxID=3364260 RepID=UPI00371CFBB2
MVGVGPRGLATLERISASLRDDDPPVRVHLIDPYLGSGGRVWRTDQSPELLLNTVASQVTMYTDDSVGCAGPVRPGPSLYTWAKTSPDLPPLFATEAAALGPNAYPSRALYGHYLVHVLNAVLLNRPASLTVELHRTTVVDLRDGPDEHQEIDLLDGGRLQSLDAVVLTLGHLPTQPTDEEAAIATFAGHRGLAYVPPDNAADVRLGHIAAGEPVILRGLGLSFFDYLALLTTGRGGVFDRRSDGRLQYRPSRQEPRLIGFSRRGIPHQARGENEKGVSGRHQPLVLTMETVDRLRERRQRGDSVRFGSDVWPLVDREVRLVYYATLICGEHGPAAAQQFRSDYACLAGPEPVAGPLDRPESNEAVQLLRRFGVAQGAFWSWQRIVAPHAGESFATEAEYRKWLVSYLEDDVRQARLGNVSGPVKAALDVLRDLRNEIRLVVDHAGVSGDSYRDEVQRWFTPLNAYLSIGPPARRIEEMIALIGAGILHVAAPGATLDYTGREFRLRSAVEPGHTIQARTLIEARIPDPDLRRSADLLTQNLSRRGECGGYRIPIPGGGEHRTTGLAVTTRPYHLIDNAGRPHPHRYAFGVPTEAVHWATAAGIRPGLGSVILQDADAIAQACLHRTIATRMLRSTDERRTDE